VLRTAVVLVLLALPVAARAGAQDSIAAARDLYTTAGYDEALAMLTRLRAGTTTPADIRTIDQYRAFALFALGRAEEAEKVVEGITLLDPQWTLPKGEAPPRIETLFTQARERALPGVLRQRLNAARALYAEKHYDAAAEAFTSIVLLLDDPEVARVIGADAPSMSLLASGFRDLALSADEQARTAAEAREKEKEKEKEKTADSPADGTAAPATASAAGSTAPALPDVPASTPAPAEPGGSTNDASPAPAPPAIVPPVAIVQTIPRPSEGSVPLGGPQTILLDIVIDETGHVERAEVRKSVDRFYESQLMAATRTWRYTPATQGGRPVKYLRTLEVTLSPR
jgi:TonB family protein